MSPMKNLILFTVTFFVCSTSYGMNKHLKCAIEFTKAAGVAIADTLPVTSAVVDDLVDGGNRQKGDGVMQTTAELLGGGLSFALELGVWIGGAYATQGQAAIMPPFVVPYGVAKVPYRSTRLQWQKSKLNCASN